MTQADQQLPPRQKLIREIERLMGGGLIDLQMEPEDFNTAFEIALDTYRMRSGNAMMESFAFLDVQPDVNEYRLPDEVQEVRQIFRRTIGGTSGGASIDPFSLAFTNNIYMIQNPGALGTTGAGILATYDIAMQYQMLVGRMFGMFVNYTYNSANHMLLLHRKIAATETFMLHIYNTRPENELLADPYARPMIRNYTLAHSKIILGEARSAFSTIAGPQGGFSMNGDTLKQEGQALIEKIDKELMDYLDQHIGAALVIG